MHVCKELLSLGSDVCMPKESDAVAKVPDSNSLTTGVWEKVGVTKKIMR